MSPMLNTMAASPQGTAGTTYANLRLDRQNSDYRSPDPGIEKLIAQQLTGMESVVNVGAGTGSYEPKDRLVIGVEPAITMILQRGKDTAPVVQATASHLPFLGDSFDAAIAILTVHHWPDKRAGLSELLYGGPV
jgi:SAM-dependent methyltransferase